MNTFRFLLQRIKVVSVSALILILLFSLLGAAGCTRPEDLAPAHYDKGIILLQAKDYRSAIIEFKNALQLDPRLAKAHYQLGLAYIGAGDAINAYRYLEMAAQVDPLNVDAITKAAEMLFQGNELNESRKRLNKALDLDPDHVNALILAANMELQAKHLNEAETYIEKAHRLDPGLDRVYLAKANIYLAKKNYDNAVESIEKALEINPENLAAYRALTIYWITNNNLDEAEKTLQNMFATFPDSPLPYLEMVKIKELKNDLTGAATSLQKAIEKNPRDPEIHVIEARFYERHGELQKAESSFEKAISVAAKPDDYRAVLADHYFNRKMYTLAGKQVEQVLAKYPEHMYANFVKAKLLLEKEGSINEAIALLEKLALQNPQWSEVLFYTARAYFKLHEIDRALRTIEKAVDQAPNNPDYRLLLAHLLYSKGEFEQALVEVNIALRIKSGSYAAAILYGKSLYMTESYPQALEFFKNFDSVRPNDFEILQYLGLSQMALEDYSNARKTLQKAVSVNKGYTLALEALVNILIVQNQQTRAISLLEDQIKANPLSPELLLLYGTLLFNNGSFEDALTAFRQVQEISPDTPSAYMMEAIILKQLGDLDAEIANRYRDLVHSKSIDTASQMVLAGLFEITDDTEGAKDSYRRVLELSPGFPAAANNLAWLLANDGNPDTLDEAMNLAQIAKEKKPTDPNISDTLGWVHYKQEHYYAAALEFRHAIANSPTTAQYHYHLALALEGQDKKQDALRAVKKSLAAGKAFQDRDKAEALYRKLKGSK